MCISFVWIFICCRSVELTSFLASTDCWQQRCCSFWTPSVAIIAIKARRLHQNYSPECSQIVPLLRKFRENYLDDRIVITVYMILSAEKINLWHTQIYLFIINKHISSVSHKKVLRILLLRSWKMNTNPWKIMKKVMESHGF